MTDPHYWAAYPLPIPPKPMRIPFSFKKPTDALRLKGCFYNSRVSDGLLPIQDWGVASFRGQNSRRSYWFRRKKYQNTHYWVEPVGTGNLYLKKL